jgi:transcriptional regulator with PAS, ATPase and Fis domain
MPPLRERLADLKFIVSQMLAAVSSNVNKRVSGITEDAVQKLSTYAFPYNLRELDGVLERAVMSAQDGVVRSQDIHVGQQAPFAVHQGAGAHSANWEAEAQWAPGRTLDDIERAVILKSLSYHNGNRTHTAKELGISIRTLRNKLNLYRKAGISI